MSTSLDPDRSDADGWHRLADHRLTKMTAYQRRINAATRTCQDVRSRTLADDPERQVADAILAALAAVSEVGSDE